MATSPTNNGAQALLALNSAVENKNMIKADVSGENGSCVGKISGTDFEYVMWKERAVIGRNSSHGQVDVNIGLSSYVSRKHLQIFRERNRYFLKCLGKNGVFVDGLFQRLGGDPLPLKPACTIRFPSTNIRLYFSIVKTEGDNNIDTNGKHLDNFEKPKLPELPVPTIPENEETIQLEPVMADVQMLPVSKPFIPVRDPYIHNLYSNKGFLSAPPSPTGTISAANSCPASPRGGTSHHNSITENLKVAAAYAAKVVRSEIIDRSSDSPPRDDQKPPYSYAQLIIQAITSSKNKHLTLSGIYAHITKHYPYYRTADKGWQNSIRHNLSLNRYFVKVPRSQEESGKGSFWRIDPVSEHKLVDQAWRKRRQRGVPCFRAPLGNISATRSAPASPVNLNPISPQSQDALNLPQHSMSHSLDKEQRVQFMQAPRFPQSAPGSPATLSTAVMSTGHTISTLATVQQQNPPVIMNAKSLPVVSAVGKVLWPMDVTKPQVAFSGGHHISNPVGSNGVVTNDGVIRATTIQDPRKLSIVMPPQQQVVMVAGQPPPGAQVYPVTQAYPVTLGTIMTSTNIAMAQPLTQGAQVIMKRQYTQQLQPLTTTTEDVKRMKLEIEDNNQNIVVNTEVN